MQTFQYIYIYIYLSDKICIEIDVANVEFHLEPVILSTKYKGNLLDNLKN